MEHIKIVCRRSIFDTTYLEMQQMELTLMVNAYLKVDIETGKEKEVKTALKKIHGVKSADFVTGTHDLVSLVEGKNYEEIVTKTLSEVRKVKGIKKTTTDFVFEWA